MKSDQFIFYFVGGSAGSFVKSIFYYYLYKMNLHNNKITLLIDPNNGNCHSNGTPRHYHNLNEIDKSKQIIAIDFDDDDIKIIIKMVLNKVMFDTIAKNPNLLKINWDGQLSDIHPYNRQMLEKTFIQNPHLLIFQEWKANLKEINPVLVLSFKEILFGDVNKKIIEFLGTNSLPEVEEFVAKYKKINSKYIDKLLS